MEKPSWRVEPTSATAGWFDAYIMVGAHPHARLSPARPADVADHLAGYSMAGALVGSMRSWLNDPWAGNHEAIQAAARIGAGARPVWTALPPTRGELDDPEELVRQAQAQGVAAFRLYPETHGYDLLDAVMAPLLGLLVDAALPLCLDRPEVDWRAIRELASRFGTLPLVVSQIGYRELREASAALGRHSNVHLDLVNLASHRGLEWLCSCFGAERLVFGSGFGLRDPGEAILRLAWSAMDDDTVDQIGRRNAERLFGTWGAR